MVNELLPVILTVLVLLTGAIYYRFWSLTNKRQSQINFLIAQAAAVPPYLKSMPRLQQELSRSRRLQRPMSIVVIKAADVSLPSDAGLKRIEFLLCGASIRHAVRDLDITAYDGVRNRFIIAMPECTRAQAARAIARLTHVVEQRVAEPLVFTSAAFPDDAVTIDDLIVQAEVPEVSPPSLAANTASVRVELLGAAEQIEAYVSR